jgi:predicted phosphodiesterase
MRIALLSDIHGNPIALDAVLAEVQAQGDVDAYWILGDLAAIGYDPVSALERLAGLPNVCFARGNTDRYVVTGERPNPTFAAVESDPRLLPLLADVAHSFAWTQGAITATGWLEWLAALPFEQRAVLPDGARLLGVHASPGSDEHGVRPGLSEVELRSLFAGCDADLVCVGHTHWPMELRVDGVHVVNLGSVSNPLPPDLRASYAILEADESSYRIEHRRVDYDHQAVIAAAQRVRHPVAGYIARYMTGQRRAGWMQKQRTGFAE